MALRLNRHRIAQKVHKDEHLVSAKPAKHALPRITPAHIQQHSQRDRCSFMRTQILMNAVGTEIYYGYM